MTREEAKRILYVYRAVNLVDASHREAFDMVIEALEQERSRSAEITQYRHDCEKLMEENERLKKALEQEPCNDCISRQAVEEIKEIMTDISGNSVYAARMSDIRTLTSVTPQPCGDAISRDAVLDLIEHYNSDGLGSVFYGYEEGVKFAGAVNKLPLVSPQQRTGRWIQKEEEGEAEPFIIWECSECHCIDEDVKPPYKYCPQCGAKMEVK